MANRSDGLASGPEVLDQLDRVLVRDEIEHGAVAAGVEDGIELVDAAENAADCLRVLPERLLVLVEAEGTGVILGEFDGGGVERRFTTLGRHHGEFGILGREHVIGMRELRLGG